MPDSSGSSTTLPLPVRGWFADCSPAFRSALLAAARPRQFEAGAMLYRAEETTTDLFAILTGVITVQCRFAHPDAVLLHFLWPGHWFGSLDVLAGRRRRYSAIARTNVALLQIPSGDVRALLQAFPEGAARLGGNAVYGFDMSMQAAADLLIRDAAARCAAVVLRLADRRWASGHQADVPVEIPVSQTELAMLCNVSRKTLSGVLRRFAEEGLLTAGYRTLTLHRPRLLRIVSDAG